MRIHNTQSSLQSKHTPYSAVGQFLVEHITPLYSLPEFQDQRLESTRAHPIVQELEGINHTNTNGAGYCVPSYEGR